MFRAVSRRIIRCNPLDNAKYEKDEKKIRFLQKGDVMKLMAMRMNDRGVELARLMFVLSCFTGMAIADMETLEYRHIQTAADGQRYIRKERQKTKVEFIVPLHPIAEAIIYYCRNEQEHGGVHQSMKKKGESLVFQPHCSRSVMGKNLSIVGKACGIRQRLSYHTARHREFYKRQIINRLCCSLIKGGNDKETSKLLYSTLFCHFKEPLFSFAKILFSKQKDKYLSTFLLVIHERYLSLEAFLF